MRDLLIAGLGDSIAAGEGNPDRPVALSDEGFCFRRFLARAQRVLPAGPRRLSTATGPATQRQPATPPRPAEWARHGARWMSAACHRSLYGYQMRTALALAVENPHVAVTFLPLACTGATIENGVLGSQRAREQLPADRALRRHGAGADRAAAGGSRRRRGAAAPDRKLDLVLLTVGANDIDFSGLVANVIISAGAERVLFKRRRDRDRRRRRQRMLDRELPGNFAKLRAR